MWNYFEENRKVFHKLNNFPWTMIPLNNQRFAASVFFDAKKFSTILKKLEQINIQQSQDFFQLLHKHMYPNLNKRNNQQQILPCFPLQDQDQKSYKGLKFNSNFESGNLYAAIKVGEKEYDLLMQNDYNSKGNTQWFYFSVENTVKNQVCRFNIINFVNKIPYFILIKQQKNDSLFNYGQKPVVFSTKKNQKQKSISWHKSGQNINYFRNRFKRGFQSSYNLFQENSQNRFYYTLSFTYRFEHQDDTVFFAQSYPYSYSQLTDLVDKYKKDQKIQRLECIKVIFFLSILQIKELCKSYNKLQCPLLVIRNPDVEQVNPYLFCNYQKFSIVIMARQHPGETPGSFMMEGVMDFLLGQYQEADTLRSIFTIYLIPMINPDGVAMGNYRCNMNGQDLNRIWHNPSRDLHDSVWHVRELVREIKKQSEIKLILDLHGHSKKYNSFFYGNPSTNPLRTRLLPLIASQINKGISIQDCTFGISDCKRNTARVALYEEIPTGLSYTFETSFHGYQNVQHKHFLHTFSKDRQKISPLRIIKIQGETSCLPFINSLKLIIQQLNLPYLPYYPQNLNHNLISLSKIQMIIWIKQLTQAIKIHLEVNQILKRMLLKTMNWLHFKKSTRTLFCQSFFFLKRKQIDQKQIQDYRSLRKKIKCDKYTQTDINQFQNIMLDPSVLKIVDQQLQELRRQNGEKFEIRPNTAGYNSDQQHMSQRLVNDDTEQSEANSLQVITLFLFLLHQDLWNALFGQQEKLESALICLQFQQEQPTTAIRQKYLLYRIGSLDGDFVAIDFWQNTSFLNKNKLVI